MKTKLTSLEKKWILYDVGNSAFIMLVSTLIPIYFKYLAGNAGISESDYLVYWGYAVSLSTLLVAVSGPIFGTLSDKKGYKKRLFLISIALGAIGCFALGLVQMWLLFLVVFIIAKYSYSMSLIFYDSMLNDVTEPERMDDVSSQGYAWGYIGSCVPFIACLLLVLNSEKIGISMETAMLCAFALTAVWWVLISVPFLRAYEQKYYVEKRESARNVFAQLGSTLQEMVQDRRIFLFVLAFFFYIDGVYTIIEMSTAYGSALGLDSSGLLLALLVTQFVAFPSAIIMGKLSGRVKSETLITICIVAYFCVAVFAIFMTSQLHFWILAVGVGMFQGGIQALSRSYFTKIIPADKSGEYFGLLDICGKGAALMGTLVMSALTQITDNQRVGVSAIAVFFVVGLVLFRMSAAHANEKRES